VNTLIKILLVDDEAIVRETLADFLRDCGHQVDTFSGGKEALESLDGRKYCLAIIDLQMPGIDGFTLLGRIREARPQLPVIVMTGHGTDEIEQRILAFGSAVLIRKPVKLRELEALMAKLCP
jgi:DNA-binding response OmpR family regulator